MSKKDHIRVAVAQVSSVGFDTAKTLNKLESRTTEAAANGAELVLFPEAFIGTYPKGLSFGATIGNRTLSGRNDFVRYFDNAISVNGPETSFMSRVAKDNHIYLVTGVIERDGGTLYCSVFFFGPDGHFMGKHRKLMPTASERLIWGYGDGSTMPIFDTPIGKMGAVICWENYMPLMRAVHYAKGIELYLAPTADGRKTWLSTIQHIALEGRCFVLSCNQFSRRSDFPDEYEGNKDSPETVMNLGGSCIVSPLGEIVVGPNYENECVLVADIDMKDIIRGKFDFDAVGHYARPDIFQLNVNEKLQSAALFSGVATEAEGETKFERQIAATLKEGSNN